MQNRFVEGYPESAPGGPALLRRINAFAVVCRGAGLRVIHTAHVLRPDGSNAPMGIPEPAKALLMRGSHASMLHKDLVVTNLDTVLEKPRYGAFTGTDLEIVLRAHGIDAVIVGGITTNVCCDTTAREAVARDFRPLFPQRRHGNRRHRRRFCRTDAKGHLRDHVSSGIRAGADVGRDDIPHTEGVVCAGSIPT